MGVALLTQHIMNACQRALRDAVLATEGLSEPQSASVIKVIGQMRSDTFKRRLAW